jgi:stage II sporulation protein D
VLAVTGRSSTHISTRLSPRLLGALLVPLIALAMVVDVGSLDLGVARADAAAVEPTFDFNGGGYGHGVGMSQYGALGRAEAGDGYKNILHAYYHGTTVSAGPVSSNLRIHLSSSTSVQITPVEPVRIFVNNKAAGNAKIGTPFTVNYTGSQISVVAPSIGCNAGACVGGGAYIPLSVGKPVGLSSTQHRYQRGQLRFTPNGSTMRVLISNLSMQAYLYGIAEVPNSWPTHALRAQAVAARSFAEDRTQARRASNEGFDLLATTYDQAYSGYEKEAVLSLRRNSLIHLSLVRQFLYRFL